MEVYVIEQQRTQCILEHKPMLFTYNNYMFYFPCITSNKLQSCVCGFFDKWTSTNQVKQVLQGTQRKFLLGGNNLEPEKLNLSVCFHVACVRENYIMSFTLYTCSWELLCISVYVI